MVDESAVLVSCVSDDSIEGAGGIETSTEGDVDDEAADDDDIELDGVNVAGLLVCFTAIPQKII